MHHDDAEGSKKAATLTKQELMITNCRHSLVAAIDVSSAIIQQFHMR